MLQRSLILLIGLAACMPAWAQMADVLPPGQVPFIATGTTAPLTEAFRAAESVNVIDFGADPTGAADSSSAFNAAMAAIRAKTYGPWSYGLPSPVNAARFIIPQGRYKIQSTLNWTGLYAISVIIDCQGCLLDGQTNRTPVIDALGSRFLRVYGLSVYGNPAAIPSLGMQIGRISSNSADDHFFSSPRFFGLYSLAAFYNYAAETTLFEHAYFWNNNSASGTYALIMDGANQFGITSAFVTSTAATNSASSFQENTCLVCNINSNSTTGSSLFISAAGRHKYIDSYIGQAGPYAVVLDASYGTTTMLDFDVHVETNAVTDEFFITGSNANPVFQGFKIRDNESFPTNSIFKLNTGIASATLANADLEIKSAASAAHMFDAPALWHVSGQYSLPTGTGSFWNLATNQFNGRATVGQVTSFVGDGSNLTGIIASFPSIISASAVQNMGGVTSVALGYEPIFSGSGQYLGTTLAGVFPTVTVSAPPPGGSQASVAVATMKQTGSTVNSGIGSGGTGYQVGDILTFVGGTFTTAATRKVTAVNGSGTITGLTWGQSSAPYGGGVYTALPTEPIAFSGGHGTGATAQNVFWGVNSYAVTASGSGYTTTPTITVQAGDGSSGSTALAVATLGSSLSLSAGASIALSSAGVQLGNSGSAGSPVIAAGALVDGSGVRQSLGNSYTVPANTSLVRFIQGSTVASSTVTLPAALADGQPIQFVNYAGAVTALTFSPAVYGWTNGSTLAAYTGLRVRWDAISAAWYREQ